MLTFLRCGVYRLVHGRKFWIGTALAAALCFAVMALMFVTMGMMDVDGTMTFSNAVDTATADGLDLDRMFHRFYQSDGARSGSGSGLGLAVAKSLAESMGMRLYAAMDGMTLSITLDMGPAVHDGTGPGASMT